MLIVHVMTVHVWLSSQNTEFSAGAGIFGENQSLPLLESDGSKVISSRLPLVWELYIILT
jgi:hypothetical protein